MGLYRCDTPAKERYHSWREAKAACRRIAAQEGRKVHAYPCGDHLHLTSQRREVQPTAPERSEQPEPPERLVRQRYANRPRRLRRGGLSKAA